MRYLPPFAIADMANIVVDGAPNATTKLVLSHWPHSGTPHELLADTSAEIVTGWLAREDRTLELDIVTTDHFDEDGLLGVWAMTAPDLALRHRSLLEGAARAGDFGTYGARDAARVAFAISALADPSTSPLGPHAFEGSYPEVAARLYATILPRVPDLLADIHAARELWQREDELLTRSEARIASGEIAIAEYPEVDLAVVVIPDRIEGLNGVHRFAQSRSAVVHPMAVHNRTERLRVLFIQGRSYELQLRYESWVQYTSRRPMPRPDLVPLANRLSELDDTRWMFDGVERITPRLHRAPGDSKLAPSELIELVTSHLAGARAAWNPYADGTR
jgi:hypothetical protein